MKQEVVLRIRGQQSYDGQEPEVIELVTEGTMCMRDGGWEITYQESALTGLDGVQTTFRVEPQKVTLTRTGKLQSEMVFQQGVAHDSLYHNPPDNKRTRWLHKAVVFFCLTDPSPPHAPPPGLSLVFPDKP